MPEVYIVKVDKRIDASLTSQVTRHLSVEKQSRIHRFRNYDDARRSLTSDLLVRSLVMNKLALNNAEIIFGENGYNKPFLENNPQFEFNVSHSEDWVVCAVDRHPVGIDVEQMKPIDLGIAERFFTADEYRKIMERKGTEQLAYFYQLWTLKESYIKAIGKGLSIPLDSFSFQDEEAESMFTVQEGQNPRYFLTTTCLPSDYMLSVCAIDQGPIQPVSIIEQDLYDFFLRL